ncbi:MAG: hypothetical protein A2Z02_03145 [Chloroflexi bacterium RBG_16_48_7]|nr:MAG: hypothetical protein A2Z02_03145 [Chloroflexi bacterium RBG_16_48_7]
MAVSLCGIIVLGMLLALPAMINADSNQDGVSAADFTKIYKNALISPLTKATSEATDPQLAQFSQKLVSAYGLENTGANTNEQSNLSDLVPDIAKINKVALDMPLKEAGKQIQDKELSEFYNRFISRCGVGK